MNKSDLVAQIGRLWFSSIRMYTYRSQPGEAWERRLLHAFVLCRVTEGMGAFIVNGAATPFHKGDWLLLPPGTMVEGSSHQAAPARLTLFFFSCTQLNKQPSGWQAMKAKLPFEGKLGAQTDERVLKDLTNQLHHLYESREAEARLTIKHVFAKLLISMMAEIGSSEAGQEEFKGLELALAYMNNQYMNDIKVNQLAKLAGFSVNHFTRMFKQQFNLTPTEYLMERRMAKAKQLLVSRQKMKEVAEQVGFQDEHYFSRAFKKTQGAAPTLYFKSNCHRIGALYYGLDDHLHTLGLQPVTFLSYAERVSHDHDSIRSNSQMATRLSSFSPNYDKLMRTKPDLLLTSDRLEQDDTYPLIAPTATFTHSDEGGGVLEQIAALLGKEQQAATWIEQYSERKYKLSQSIRSRWGKQSAYFIRVSARGSYRVYGSRNQTGSLLYDDLGLSIPAPFMDGKWAINILLENIPEYDANHLFLMTDPSEEARDGLKALMQSEQWASLEAVRSRQVYDASDLMFKALGSSSRLNAMNRIAAQLGV